MPTTQDLSTSVHHGDMPETVLKEALSASSVAMDIETSGLDWASDQIFVCQILLPGDAIHLVQVDSEQPPSAICRLVEAPSVRKIFHHAMFDLRFMTNHWGARPKNIACTKVASKIVQPNRERHSLKDLLRERLGITISKAQQTSDWSKKVLSDNQIEYAASDVRFLPPLLDHVLEEACSLDRKQDVEASFEYIPTRVQLDLRGSGDVFTY
jgi:ribonuclease D